jgi:SAM-dependent methyltransferase
METDIGTHEERWVLARLDAQPWREALAATLADNHPELYARLTDPAPAAVVSLLEIGPGERCLDATGGWGQIAVPLARRAHVVALAPSVERAAIIRHIAEQEGVAVEVAVGALADAAFAAAEFDVLLLHDQPRSDSSGEGDAENGLGVLRDVARLLRASGRAYLAVGNPLAPPAGTSTALRRPDAAATFARFVERFAAAGLSPVATYACFPDHERPRFFVPLALVDDFVRAMPPSAGGDGLTPIYAALADEGIARHFAPSFAFILKPQGNSQALAG